MDAIRTLVSGSRRRYQQDGFDLDLTYITPRVIAMGFPAEGVEGAYRNSLDEVSRFFHLKHGAGNYLIINLSERPYNYARLGSEAVLEMGFPDLHTCPLHLALTLARRMQEFLDRGPRKVVAVHCLAGKGRTGVVAAAWLLSTLAVRDPLFDAAALAQGVPLPGSEEGSGSSVDGGGAAAAAAAPTEEELAAVDASVPPAFELCARAVQAFRLLRGDGLNYTAQRRTVFYVAVLVREALIQALAAAGEGARLLALAPTAPAAARAPRYALALPLLPSLAPPAAPTVMVWNLVLHGVPRLRGSAKASGCSPSAQLRSLPHQHLADITLYDTSWACAPGELPVYCQDDEVLVIHVNAVLSGDVLLRVMHHPGQDGEEPPSAMATVQAGASTMLGSAMSALGAGLSSAAAAVGWGASAALSAVKPNYVAPRRQAAKRAAGGSASASSDAGAPSPAPAPAPAPAPSGADAPSPASPQPRVQPLIPLNEPASSSSLASPAARAAAAAAENMEAAPLALKPQPVPLLPAAHEPAAAGSSGGGGSPVARQLSMVLEVDREDEEDEEEAGARDEEDDYDGPSEEPLHPAAGMSAEDEAALAGEGGEGEEGARAPRSARLFLKPVEIFRYSFHTAFMDHQWGQGVHRVFRADLDMDKRTRSPWKLPKDFHMDIVHEVKGSAERKPVAPHRKVPEGWGKPPPPPPPAPAPAAPRLQLPLAFVTQGLRGTLLRVRRSDSVLEVALAFGVAFMQPSALALGQEIPYAAGAVGVLLAVRADGFLELQLPFGKAIVHLTHLNTLAAAAESKA